MTLTTNTTACIGNKDLNLSTLGEVFSLSQEPALCYNERRKLKGFTMSKEVIVESFELDHTIVKAPYVRLIGEETGPKGDIISNYDIR